MMDVISNMKPIINFEKIYSKIKEKTLISKDRLWVLYQLAEYASENIYGDFFECGVYKGGSALLLADIISGSNNNSWFMNTHYKEDSRVLRLFDTFNGMPESDPNIDFHKKGDFNASYDEVKEYINNEIQAKEKGKAISPFDITYYPGIIPETFKNLDEDVQIAFAHIDVDIYSSVKACCEFIYPRLTPGGIMLFDDYGFDTCKGAKKACDEFFEDKTEILLPLNTGQAVVYGI